MLQMAPDTRLYLSSAPMLQMAPDTRLYLSCAPMLQMAPDTRRHLTIGSKRDLHARPCEGAGALMHEDEDILQHPTRV
jgi:hypothetical protein